MTPVSRKFTKKIKQNNKRQRNNALASPDKKPQKKFGFK